MSWTRRAFLGSLAASAALPSLAAAPDRKLILVVAAGGWDVSFALDPKGDAVDGPGSTGGQGVEDVAEWGELAIGVNDLRRPAVRTFFDSWADQTAVINGISTGTLSHERSLSRVLSGSWDAHRPDLATLVGAADERRPLGTIDLSGFARFGEHAGRCARWGPAGTGPGPPGSGRPLRPSRSAGRRSLAPARHRGASGGRSVAGWPGVFAGGPVARRP